MGLRRRATGCDKGVTSLEYAALIGVAVAIIGALFLTVQNPVAEHTRIAICKLFGGGASCDAGPPFDYKPSTAGCILGTNSHKAGASITVFSVKVGQNFQLVRTRTADGKVTLTVVPVDFKLGAEAELGAGLKLGKSGGLGAELGAKVEGSVNLKIGDAWKFNNEDEANAFLDKMKWDLARREAEKVSPGLWIFDKVTGWKPRTPDPQIQQVEIGVEGALKGALGIGKVTDKQNENGDTERSITDTGTGLEIEGKAGDAVLITKDNSGPADKGYPLSSVTFQVKGTIKGGAKIAGYGPGGEATYLGQTKVTRNKDGKLVSITWITTHESNDSEGIKNPGNKQGSAKNANKRITTTSTTLEFDDTNRNVGEQWIQDNAFLMPFQTIRNAADENGGFRSDDPGPNASPIDRLLYERGKVSRNTYAGNVDEYGIAGKVALGVKFGFEAAYEGEQQQLVSSQYLGAPVNGQRTFQTWPECKER